MHPEDDFLFYLFVPKKIYFAQAASNILPYKTEYAIMNRPNRKESCHLHRHTFLQYAAAALTCACLKQESKPETQTHSSFSSHPSTDSHFALSQPDLSLHFLPSPVSQNVSIPSCTR